MLRSLEEIRDRLIAEYDPDRIVLYGSHARGEALPDSDFDLLVIKDTDLRPIDRRAEVERLLADRDVPIDVVVYTPAELQYLFAIGSPLVEEMMETGRLLYMRKATLSWLKDAQDELAAAEVLLEHGAYKGTCYHSQQSVEKGLKALILERGERPSRVHDLMRLRNSAMALGCSFDLETEDAVFLNSIYKSRYPTEDGLLPHGEPTEPDARRAVAAAQRFLASVAAALA